MQRSKGFSLLELTIVLVIMAALTGGLLMPVATRIQSQRLKQTEHALEGINEALYGFAMSRGKLPCPDTDTVPDGQENTPCPPLSGGRSVEGFLPWNDLGVAPTDAWGRLYYYAVVTEFTEPTATPNECTTGGSTPVYEIDLCDIGAIDVIDPGAGISLTDRAPAVVVSVGPNGLGGWDLASGTRLPVPLAPPEIRATDEMNNLPDNTLQQFVSRPYRDNAAVPCDDGNPGASACNFDDLISWISAPILFNRMVVAGQLP